MNSAPHLLNEDRAEYERILDETLRTAQHRPDLAAPGGGRFDNRQLRAMALDATALITAAAAAEYQRLVELRKEFRTPTRGSRTSRGSAGPASGVPQSAASGTPGGDTGGLATVGGAITEPTGAGLLAVVAVLAPVLAGASAAIFLLVGYLLMLLSPAPAFARTMLTTGWVFGAITALAILLAAVGLLLTALRNGSTSLRADTHSELLEEMERARDAWRHALVERGIVPFLKEALLGPGVRRPIAAQEPISRIPHLGYHRPGFSSPDTGSTAAHRPRYSSPDFSSPDFGEHDGGSG